MSQPRHRRRSGLVALSMVLAVGCKDRGEPTNAAAHSAGQGAHAAIEAPRDDAAVLASLARAEDQRRARDVTVEAQTSPNVILRRRAARALARIADASSLDGLERALFDEDEETVAWGAFGLGTACDGGATKGRASDPVHALAARYVSLVAERARDAGGGAREIDPVVAILRAIGRCGGAMAERFLATQLNTDAAEWAAYALGDIAAKAHALTPPTIDALLTAAVGRRPPGAAAVVPPNDAALYPFGRLDRVREALAPKLLAAARAALERSSEQRVFAIRALGRSGPDALPDLVHVVRSPRFSPAERAEAAHALGSMGQRGHEAAAEALASIVRGGAIDDAGEASYGLLTTLLAALGPDPPKRAEAALRTLADREAKGGAAAVRRAVGLRCAAAAVLARRDYEADELRRCDPASGEAYEKMRLRVVLRGRLRGARREAWAALARSKHLRVREAAIEAIADHPELGDAARSALADALNAVEPGLVATAAEVIHAHPDRAVARGGRRESERDFDPAIVRALEGALARPWGEDAIEARLALLDAGLAIGLEKARTLALAACRDPNVTARQRAQKALSTASPAASCSAEHSDPTPAEELREPITRPTRVTFETDVGRLAIRFDPALAPVTTTRLVALARAGFFNGVVVHRVVPWFVVQFGDRGGDGYGGAGKLLRCESSPLPFAPFDVGVALAGRDTGSSQLFVTLARTPHLDGAYARVGRAEGDWNLLVEGDVIQGTTVEE